MIGVEPGGFQTSIWDKAEADLQRERGSTTPHLYGIGRQVFQTLRPRMGDPADVARVIGEALQAGQPRRTYKVGWDAWGLAATAHLVPDRLRDRLVRTATRPGRERGIP